MFIVRQQQKGNNGRSFSLSSPRLSFATAWEMYSLCCLAGLGKGALSPFAAPLRRSSQLSLFTKNTRLPTHDTAHPHIRTPFTIHTYTHFTFTFRLDTSLKLFIVLPQLCSLQSSTKWCFCCRCSAGAVNASAFNTAARFPSLDPQVQKRFHA